MKKIKVIEELPLIPEVGASYSFARLKRKQVTYSNHGLHKYPAKFIPQIPKWALAYDPTSPARIILDPFCGSGTTLIEAGIAGCDSIGVDISPLACLISLAKTAIIVGDKHRTLALAEDITDRAIKRHAELTTRLEGNQGKDCLGMHYTWSNWFNASELAGLLSLRYAIDETETSDEVKNFSKAILSSITKSCSFLNEDQIKVRFDHDKVPANPFKSFKEQFAFSIGNQLSLSLKFIEAGSHVSVVNGCAANLDIEDGSIDRIITSPPYINAVDYTMAHKYNLFLLGEILPSEFKDHCRAYIGVTERAVRACDVINLPQCEAFSANDAVNRLGEINTPTSRNRAYVVAQYFSEMEKAFAEGYRVLRRGGRFFLVIGEYNRICSLLINTADILEEIANLKGFETETSFFHVLANRSSMRLNRSDTGGTINREKIYVFRRN